MKLQKFIKILEDLKSNTIILNKYVLRISQKQIRARGY